jgi:hypothetical protein
MNNENLQNDKILQVELSFEDINLILKALGNLPFNQVYDLIGRIHDQANSQMQK